MFTTEVFATEYIEEYFTTKCEMLKSQESIVLYGINEQAFYLKELCDKYGVKVQAFASYENINIGKEIMGIPVIQMKQIPVEAFVIVSSATTAYHDRDLLEENGFAGERIETLYPNTIEYFKESFEKIDREQYKGIRLSENLERRNRESRSSVEVTSVPSFLYLDLTTKCNLNCCHCDAHHNREVSKYRNQNETYIPLSRYQFLFDYANEIYLNISGEPLLAKDFWSVLDYIDASENDPYLFSVTNGLLLNEKAATRIVQSKFKKLIVSMDASTCKTYGRLRRGGDYDLWYKNVKRLMELIKEYNSNLYVMLQYTVSREGLEDVPGAVEAAAKLGVHELDVRPIYTEIPGKEDWYVEMDPKTKATYYYPQQDMTYYPHVTKRILDQSREMAKEMNVNLQVSNRFDIIYDEKLEDIPYPLELEEFYEIRKKADDYLHSRPLPKPEAFAPVELKDAKLCVAPWDMAMIFTSGNIMYCNRMEMMEGNINFSSFYDLRNNAVARRVRKGLVEGDLAIDCITCSGCEMSETYKLKQKETKYFAPGESIQYDLENSDNVRVIRTKGVSRIQRNGAWNNLTTSTVEFYVKEPVDHVCLEVTGEPFVIPGLLEEQNVVVRVNGTELAKWNYSNSQVQTKQVSIPASFIAEDRKVILEMEFLNGTSPLSLGMGRDERKRALFIQKIERIS